MNKKNINKNSRVAIVTGGTKNIGLAVCKALLKNNIKVAIVGSNDDSIKNTFNQSEIAIFKESIVKGYVCDLSNITNIKDLVTEVSNDFGGIDIIINSAGILDLSKVEETSLEKWNETMAINLTAPFFLVQNALTFLKKSSLPRIINIASNAGRMGGYANGMSYTASKGGLISLTYGLARQLAKWDITVNCVAPGTIESDMLESRDPHIKNKLLENFPLRRFGDCDEVSEAVMYFVSEKSSFTTGAVLDVNGGLFTG